MGKNKADPALSDLVTVRHPYERARVRTPVRGVSMTHQSHKDLCDINHIVRRFAQTGVLPTTNRELQYADLTEMPANLDEKINMSRTTLDKVGRAEEAHKAAAVKKKQQAQVDLEEEVKRLRQLEADVKTGSQKTQNQE